MTHRHMEVVDIDEPTRSERREANKTGGDANWLLPVEGKEDSSGRMRAEPWDQHLQNVIGEVATVAHRITSIVTGHLKHGRLMLRVVKVGSDDAKSVHHRLLWPVERSPSGAAWPGRETAVERGRMPRRWDVR